MKKQLMTACAAALIAMGMTACDKTGTIEGVVLDPFTEQPVPMPTVWMDSTIYTTTKEKYPYKEELQKGEFKFNKVPVGSYRILAGRSKYVKSRNPVQTTEAEPNLKVKLYIYSDQVNPGLYKTGEKTPTKINNEWVLFSTQCTESIAGYRLEMPAASETAKLPPAPKADKKAKGKKGKKAKKAAAPAAAPASKMIALSAPLVVDGKLNVLYVNASSVTAPLVAKTFAAVEDKVANHKDCKGFAETDVKGIFPDKSKATDLQVTYVAENLYKISGDLPKGKQIIQLSQEGKTLQTYYFEVK
ncbi:hypothetical protein SAMN05720761_10489 [Fibrobacter sp. UWCM]|uniref:hypothetical protein n=1 Tax=Fibrobacter sp. UWCM TaxID=1896208 RepID=UPI0009149586|nr:hypothetical protein [Fibrobacter sp. UWCM]SHG70936.1 hypothetical protein SAMN05720761_10489 [Fibrobacter sp. UWCM]